MFALDAQLTAGEVLRAFHHDEPFLFLGAAFNTVTVILIGLCVIRRKVDGLLLSLAWFAHLYGIRLWINSDLLHLSIPPSEFFHRLSAAVDYIVPVPAFLFFQFAGFLGKAGKVVTPLFVILFLGLSAGSMILGAHAAFHEINNTVIAVALIAVAVHWARRMMHDRDSRAIGFGLLCFVAPAIFDNIYGPSHIEPYGFAILLACLGYVAARRTLQRDKELDEIQQELGLARRIQLSILMPPSLLLNLSGLRQSTCR